MALVVCALALLAVLSAGCGIALGSGPTPDPRLALIQVVSTQTRLIGSEVTVVGTVKNGDKVGHDITLRADFFDTAGKQIGSATGAAEDVSAGGTGDFQIGGSIDPARYATTQVTVISLTERK
jgi:hypothetical protein